MTATRHPRSATPVVTQIPLPEDARQLSTLSRLDYTDAFAVTSDIEHTPAQWVRAVVSDAPPRVRLQLYLGWTALGLRLGPPWSSNRVLGWKIQDADPDFLLLAAGSWLGLRGQLLFRSEPDGLLFATFVQQTNPGARALWAAITPRHQRVVRSLLTHGARRLTPRVAQASGSPGRADGARSGPAQRRVPDGGSDSACA
ncbi:MAG TPA: hypothetical protein VMJ65_08180 [Solirubrobacteraceae bacterium]|nr:hypothetical protein [Solirubrobacteraceae bacterium]